MFLLEIRKQNETLRRQEETCPRSQSWSMRVLGFELAIYGFETGCWSTSQSQESHFYLTKCALGSYTFAKLTVSYLAIDILFYDPPNHWTKQTGPSVQSLRLFLWALSIVLAHVGKLLIILDGEVIRFYQVKNSPGIWSSPGEEQGRAFFHMLFKQFFYMASVQHRDLGFLISQVFQCEVGTVGLNIAEERRASREKKIGEENSCDIKKYSQHGSGLQLCK